MSETGTDKVIAFSEGIPGFEEVKEFRLHTEEDTFLAWLEAAHNQNIRFVLIPPQLFFADYLRKVDLSPGETGNLEIASGDSVDVWAIMTVRAGELAKSTVNLRAPLIVNPRTNKGIQMILPDEQYSSQQLIFAPSLPESQEEKMQEGAGA